jgi:hypothetical protein
MVRSMRARTAAARRVGPMIPVPVIGVGRFTVASVSMIQRATITGRVQSQGRPVLGRLYIWPVGETMLKLDMTELVYSTHLPEYSELMGFRKETHQPPGHSPTER